jgi:hypothetical protein
MILARRVGISRTAADVEEEAIRLGASHGLIDLRHRPVAATHDRRHANGQLSPKTQSAYIRAVRSFTQYLGRSPTCTKKAQCCPNTPMRKSARSLHEDAQNVARGIAKTPEYQQSRCERKNVEMLFAHLKRIVEVDQLRLRGLSGASDEFTLAATAQNLRRLAKQACPLPAMQGIGAPS